MPQALRPVALIMILAAALLPAIAQSPNPDLKIAAVQYSAISVPEQYHGQLIQWLPRHFNWLIGNRLDLSAHTKNIYWSAYMDSGGITVPMMYEYIHDVAAQNGWNSENMFLHLNRDYQVSTTSAWDGMDQFDIWEQKGGATGQGVGTPGNAVNGAFICDHICNDVTVPLYQGKCGGDCKVKNMLYLGYAEPFALVNITVATGRDGGTAAWEYWNGSSWSALTLDSDSTKGITGTGSINFTPPRDWKPNVVNHSRSKYWVRLVVAHAKTPPLLTRVTGDDWLSHSGQNNMRGWSASDPNRKNQGLGKLEYNPDPPPQASAHFRYQARASGYWAHNYLYTNPGDVQGGKITFPAALLARWVNERRHDRLKFNSLMLDNVGGHLNPTNPKWNENLTDLPCSPHCRPGALMDYVKPMLQAVSAEMKAGNGKDFAVGGNVGNAFLKDTLDLLFLEFTFLTFRTGDVAGQLPAFDALDPANNAKGTQGSFAGWDNQHFGLSVTQAGATTRHLWDNGNRTPMATLATYYMGANPNTMFLYNSQGWSYFDTDEYYYWASRATTLAAPLSADSSTGPKRIHLADGKGISVPGGFWSKPTDYVLQIGGQDVVRAARADNTTFLTQTPLVNSYPAGTPVRFALMAHHCAKPSPAWKDIYYYANWFPAMLVDVGTPDPKGWHGGARDTAYLTGTAASTQPSCNPPGRGYQCAEVWRRDFANAIILDRVIHDNTLASELDSPGPPINLKDATRKLFGPYYQLYSDGTTGPAITSVSLRAGEAAILMKHPVERSRD